MATLSHAEAAVRCGQLLNKPCFLQTRTKIEVIGTTHPTAGVKRLVKSVVRGLNACQVGAIVADGLCRLSDASLDDSFSCTIALLKLRQADLTSPDRNLRHLWMASVAPTSSWMSLVIEQPLSSLVMRSPWLQTIQRYSAFYPHTHTLQHQALQISPVSCAC